MNSKQIPMFAAILCCALSSAAIAGWPSDPKTNIPIAVAQLEQSHPSMAPDGKGGAFVAWQDSRNNGAMDIYAQRVTLNGAIKWAVNGLVQCNANDNQTAPSIIPDTNGGAYIIWIDARDISATDTDIYATHIDSNGTRTAGWPANGLPVCTDKYLQHNFTAISDNHGGVFVAWEDSRQCFRYDTTLRYNNATHRYDTSYTCGVNGNVNTLPRIFLQHITPAGMLWKRDGILACDSTHAFSQTNPRLAPNGNGGVIVVWSEIHSGSSFIMAQDFSSAGIFKYAFVGKQICTFPSQKNNLAISADSTGGFFVIWEDSRALATNGWDLYGQRMDGTGALKWLSEGDTICKAAQDQLLPVLVTDSLGNPFLVWQDHRNLDIAPSHFAADLYGQHLNAATGTPLWTAGGVALVSQPYDQVNQLLTLDDRNGFYMVWIDYRAGTSDPNVYCMRVQNDGTKYWSASASGVEVCTATGSQTEPSWCMSNGGIIVAWRDTRTATDNGGDIYMQKVFPNGSLPVELATFNATLMRGSGHVQISWNTVAEINTLGFELLRQRDDGALIAIANYANVPGLAAKGNAGQGSSYSIVDNSASGQRCSYTLAVIDNDGSRREFGPVVVHLTSPSSLVIEPNYPNPFAGISQLGYALPHEADVTIRIVDMLGREISHAMLLAQSAGWHSYSVDGSSLAQGTYFLSVETAGALVRQRISVSH